MRSIATTDLVEISQWSRELYQSHLRRTCMNPLERFIIGLYQLGTADAWADQSNKYESRMSCAIHLIMVMECYGVGPEAWLERYIEDEPTHALDHKALLAEIASAAQHLWYGHQAGKTQRSTRFDVSRLGIMLGRAVRRLIRSVPSQHRKQAVEDATALMSGRL